MKIFRYIILVIIVLSILGSSVISLSFKNNAMQTITLQSVNPNTSEALLTESKEILLKRLNTLKIKKFEIIQNNEKSQLIIKYKDKIGFETIAGVILAKGKINFCESFIKQSVIKQLDDIQNLDCKQNLYTMLNIKAENFSGSEIVIGKADAKDTALINNCLKKIEIKRLLPDDLKLIWGNFPDNTNKFDLYALSNNDIGINEQSIQEARSVKSSYGSHSISMTLNKDAGKIWENVTQRNINKCLAFVIDNKVYSAPKVMTEIKSGSAEITGNFTETEANRFVAVICCGALPLDFKIVDNN